MLVGVGGELVADLVREDLDLFDQSGQHGQQCVGDLGVGLGVVAGDAAWYRGQAGMEHSGIGAAAVTCAGQPGGEAFRGQPVGAARCGLCQSSTRACIAFADRNTRSARASRVTCVAAWATSTSSRRGTKERTPG